MKKIRYFFEYLAVIILLALSKLIARIWGIPAASKFGGILGRFLGQFMASTRKAKRHIILAFPNMDKKTLNDTAQNMWENLGRIFFEYPHLEELGKNYTKLQGGEFLEEIKNSNTPAILIAAHTANWEVAAPAFLTQNNFAMDLIYRAPNNPRVDIILEHYRSLFGKLKTYPKSKTGMRGVVDALKNKRRIGILIDQKYNAGLEVNFFGHPAMTSAIFVQLARKFNCPIIQARIERIPHSCQFKITLFRFELSQEETEEQALQKAHAFLEETIRQNPSDWIWLHKRWRIK